jgi:hypothetical protein
MPRILGLGGLALAVLAFAVAPALAGKGNGGGGGGSNAPASKPSGGGGGGTGTSAWVSVSPNPAAANGAKVGVSGCGFNVATTEMDIVHSAGYTEVWYVPVWSPGCIDTNTYFLTKEAGTYTIKIYQMSSTKRGATKVLKASTTLTVN